MIEIRHLETLHALRDQGSLSGAAARLNLTGSALSHQLITLEERLGAELFVRKTRPVRFTRAGKRLMELADRVLPLVSEAERDISRISGRLVGRLHIAIECHSCYQWLMPTLDRYRQAWPDVELDLTAGFNFEALPALRRGELDLVVTSDPQESAEIIYHPLFRHEAVFALGRDHRLAGHSQILPEDLRGETIVAYPVERSRLDVFTDFLDPAGIEPAHVRTAELTVMILQLVASGRGVAMLPNWALTELGNDSAVIGVPVGPERKFGTLYAAVRQELADSPYIADFIAMAREVSFQTLTGISPVGV